MDRPDQRGHPVYRVNLVRRGNAVSEACVAWWVRQGNPSVVRPAHRVRKVRRVSEDYSVRPEIADHRGPRDHRGHPVSVGSVGSVGYVDLQG